MPDTTLDDVLEEVEGLRALVQGRHTSLPDEAAYSLRRARIRISLRMDPRFLSDAEVEEMLQRDDVMSGSQLRRIANQDDANPIRTVSLPAGKRILEKHIRQAERQAEKASTPASVKQM